MWKLTRGDNWGENFKVVASTEGWVFVCGDVLHSRIKELSAVERKLIKLKL